MEGLTLKAQQTARRNLAQRIGRLLTAAEKEARQLTSWEAHYASLALDDLEAHRYRDGEWMMCWATEQSVFDTPVSPKPLPTDARSPSLAELKAKLDSLWSG